MGYKDSAKKNIDFKPPKVPVDEVLLRIVIFPFHHFSVSRINKHYTTSIVLDFLFNLMNT